MYARTFSAATAWIALAVLAAAAGVPSRAAAASGNLTRGCVRGFDASTDYFPDRAVIEDAKTFTVEYHRSYKVVTVKEPVAGGPPERYVLVQCGTPVPPLAGPDAGAQVVTVPIRSLFAFSSSHVPLLVDLDRIDVLTGVSSLSLVDNPQVRARAAVHGIVEFAKTSLVVDVERVIAAKPDLLMTSGASNAALAVVRRAGIPVVANTEWLEPTPLGRAEWLKFMALFLNEEKRAQSLHEGTRARYDALRMKATALPESTKPLVMTGRSTRGTFIIAGGQSYVAAFIHDAGGRYVWSDNSATGIVSVDIEAQLARASSADVWINGGGWKSLTAMVQDEPRYGALKAYQRGEVWVYERPQNAAGGNDYWTRSITHPDLVLADLLKIFHPSLVPFHEFDWYMRVPPR